MLADRHTDRPINIQADMLMDVLLFPAGDGITASQGTIVIRCDTMIPAICTDSPDCLPILLCISVFFYFSVLLFPFF